MKEKPEKVRVKNRDYLLPQFISHRIDRLIALPFVQKHLQHKIPELQEVQKRCSIYLKQLENCHNQRPADWGWGSFGVDDDLKLTDLSAEDMEKMIQESSEALDREIARFSRYLDLSIDRDVESMREVLNGWKE